MIAKDALIVDVRTPFEFQMGHYPGAINIPVDQLTASMSQFGNKKDRPIVVYCASGSRSGGAKYFLAQAGYTNVLNGGGLYQMMSLKPQ